VEELPGQGLSNKERRKRTKGLERVRPRCTLSVGLTLTGGARGGRIRKAAGVGEKEGFQGDFPRVRKVEEVQSLRDKRLDWTVESNWEARANAERQKAPRRIFVQRKKPTEFLMCLRAAIVSHEASLGRVGGATGGFRERQRMGRRD